MSFPIQPVRGTNPFDGIASQLKGRDSSAFGEVYRDAVSRVEAFRKDAHEKVDSFLSGENEDLNTTI
jgi:hypothetical protein